MGTLLLWYDSICRHWVQNGYKWVKMDISHAPDHQYHDHPGNP